LDDGVCIYMLCNHVFDSFPGGLGFFSTHAHIVHACFWSLITIGTSCIVTQLTKHRNNCLLDVSSTVTRFGMNICGHLLPLSARIFF
jgi:hypothetical protein